MSSTNKTANLQLNQWVGTDPVLMSDFNADNAKIDAAVKAANDAIAALPHIATGSYTGNGNVGSSKKNSLNFSFSPKLVIIMGASSYSVFVRGYSVALGHLLVSNLPQTFNTVAWTSTGLNWYATKHMGYSGNTSTVEARDQFNTSGETYCYFAIG